MEMTYDNLIGNKTNTIMEIDRLSLIDSNKEWEDSWITSQLKSTLFIGMLENYGYKFSDFLLMDIYMTTLSRVNRANIKNLLRDLKLLINITNKEEEEIKRTGFDNPKIGKKIFKRIIKKYPVKVNAHSGHSIKGYKKDELTGKDVVRTHLDMILDLNIREDAIIDEIAKAVERKDALLFVHSYFLALYKGYADVLDTLYIYGEIVSGEFKHAVQELVTSKIAIFIKTATGKNMNMDKTLDELGLKVAIDLVETENIQLQEEKKFYSKRYIELLAKMDELEKVLKEKDEELQFFKDIYKNKLKNKKVLLIGDKGKESEYQEIVNSLGGDMVMYDSFEDFSKITNAVLDGFDYIVHFTYYTSHSVSNKLNKYSNNVLYVNSSSKLELEKVLVSL